MVAGGPYALRRGCGAGAVAGASIPSAQGTVNASPVASSDRAVYHPEHTAGQVARVLVLAITGVLMLLSFVGMAVLQDLRQHMVPFLVLYGVAFLGYAAAVAWSLRRPGRRGTLALMLGLAAAFRAALLFATPPTLSDDVYRFIWDGRLVNAGVNPYAHAADSPLLDPLDTPLRPLINHSDMASPYLPAAQALFAAVYRLGPESPFAFQATAALLDLLTGCVLLDLLRRFGLPGSRALIALWNPLAIVEFAHGAHGVDALMVLLIVLAFWLTVALRCRMLSAFAMAAATLTKGLPLLIVFLIARRWRLRHTIAYLALLVGACLPFALGAGWGLVGALDGRGLFGALRIYLAGWEFNAGIHHWLEASLSGLWTPGAAPQEIARWQPILAARLTMTFALVLVCLVAWRASRGAGDALALLRLAAGPVSAYLLLAATVHPWYVTLLLPLLPALPSGMGGAGRGARFVWPWLYFSWAVSLSYLSYLGPAPPREVALVRLLEYIPLYALLIWAARPACPSGLAASRGAVARPGRFMSILARARGGTPADGQAGAGQRAQHQAQAEEHPGLGLAGQEQQGDDDAQHAPAKAPQRGGDAP